MPTHESRLFLSSGFKYSPTHHYCCHSRTLSDLLTSPVKKTLEADTFIKCFSPEQKNRDRHTFKIVFFKAWILFVCGLIHTGFSHLSEVSSVLQMTGSHRTVERFPTTDVQAEVRVCWDTTQRPPTCISLDVSVLQDTSWPRVGSMFLYTIHFLFSDTRFALLKH